MNPIIRGILAVIAGLIVGGFVNMGIILLGSQIIPPPDGVDMTNMESIKASMHLFKTQHFVTPFLAHAIGTLVGALIASLIAAAHHMKLALIVGGIFMLGGLVNIFLLPAPAWFVVVDLFGAYLPMGWLGWKLSSRE